LIFLGAAPTSGKPIKALTLEINMKEELIQVFGTRTRQFNSFYNTFNGLAELITNLDNINKQYSNILKQIGFQFKKHNQGFIVSYLNKQFLVSFSFDSAMAHGNVLVYELEQHGEAIKKSEIKRFPFDNLGNIKGVHNASISTSGTAIAGFLDELFSTIEEATRYIEV
jgi:hypothetical protein